MRRTPASRAHGLRRGLARLLVLVGVVLLVPNSAVHPVELHLIRLETAKEVDFEDGVVWILVLGSDARPGEDLDDGRADAIQLIGLDPGAGNAVGIGIPRDSWVMLPELGRLDRINAGLADGGPQVVAAAVADLVGIEPHYVVVGGFTGFRDLVATVGGVEVRSPVPFRDEDLDLTVRRGLNRFGADAALSFARSRKLPGDDFGRSANQQRLLLGILGQLRAHEDDEGFMERGTMSALAGLETNLSPTELFRLAQAVTQVDPRRVDLCVISGTPDTTAAGASVVDVDERQALLVGKDAEDDAQLQLGCSR
jgi:LCP family protein required for cell wall assembly